jgi:hypothetical protein
VAKEEAKAGGTEAAPAAAAQGVNVQLVPAGSGKKIPERINGRLGARAALPYDVLANLHQQIGRVLQALAKQKSP